MDFTDILGKKNINGKPHIEALVPPAALPGGEVRIEGSRLKPPQLRRPIVRFGEAEGSIVISSDEVVIARVPYGAVSGPVVVATDGQESNQHNLTVGLLVAENLHPVTNPVLDAYGNIYATFSGSRGQKVPVSVYKIDTNFSANPFLTDVMNATGIAFDRNGDMYVSSRYEGTIYCVAPNGAMSTYAEGMGVATGIAFDREGSLYVGDRGGTIFKVGRNREIFVFAMLEPSVSAYHLAFSSTGDLYVSGPTTSSYDAIYRVDPHGEVSEYFRGLGRPQGMAVDVAGNLYVAASLSGKRGIVKITPQGETSLAVAGHNIVGLAFAPGKAAVLATTTSIYYLNWGIEGMPLYG